MNDFDADGIPEGEWDDQRELGWSEFDWEDYLRLQDEAVTRYLELYLRLQNHPERIDEAARMMGWERSGWNADAAVDEPAPTEDPTEFEPSSVHRNPVFVATRAIFLALRNRWLTLVPDPLIGSGPAFGFAVHQAEDQISMAIHALDLGDYALAVCLFKRALRELNAALALLPAADAAAGSDPRSFLSFARQALFDQREICLRLMQECRNELSQPFDEES